MRLTVAASWAAFSVALCGAAASAQPCPVELRYEAQTSAPGTFALGFRAYTDGVAELRLTLYAKDGSTYAASLPNTTFTRPAAGDAAAVKTWLSDSSYLRMPPQTPQIEAATLDVIDPDSRGPLICSGSHPIWSNDGPTKAGGNAWPGRIDPERSADLLRALQEYGPTSSTVTASPLPAAAKPECARPYVDARVAKIAEAEYPERARSMGDTGTTVVLVELDETGKVTGTALYLRSGSIDLDESARSAAVRTTYSAEIFRCAPVSGYYFFVVEFTGS